MTEFCSGIFHIQTGEFSYLFRVTKFGQLEHLHFGAPVAREDAAALALKPGTGWGMSAVLDEDDNASSPDTLPLEWSGAYRGDYRESPIELCDENGAVPTDFRYVRHEIWDGGAKMACGLPQADGCGRTLAVTLRDDGCSCELTLFYTDAGGTLLRRAELKNLGAKPVYVQKLMSFCADFAGTYDMHTFDGGWIGEARRHAAPVSGARVVNESVTGFSSNRHNPGFMLAEKGAGEDEGVVYGVNLIYSGNHYASAQTSFQGLTRVMQGISPAGFRWELLPGDSFETPECVLAFSDAGFNGLSRVMHRFVNSRIVPPAWRYRPRPVLFNDWEGCMFDFNERRLKDLARRAKKLGAELFVLDDGWFGARNSDRAGLGDYAVNAKKLPGGLSGLARCVGDMGMDFGLWFEPEAVNPDSDLYRAHPDWAIRQPGREDILCRHELLLDLTKREVRDYIVDSVSAVLDTADIRYVKWDMNRQSVLNGTRAHEYILGLYEVLGRIFAPRPDVLLESCSSGGNRFDLGMLCFSPQIWCSDDTDPVERLMIQGGLSYLYPQSCMGAHVSAAPHAQTLRQTPLSTRANVSFFGILGYELDLKELNPAQEKEIRAQTEFYKAHRQTFQFGEFSRLNAPEGWTGWQARGDDETAAGFFRGLVHAAPGYVKLRLTGLCKNTRYRVVTRPQALRVAAFGTLIKYVSPVRISPDGAILRTADRIYAMPDGREDFTATGAALMAGFAPAALFAGTGYDKNAHNQGDFGSEIYIVSEDTGECRKK